MNSEAGHFSSKFHEGAGLRADGEYGKLYIQEQKKRGMTHDENRPERTLAGGAG